MFLRSTNRKKDGKDHRYFSIVENRRMPGGKVVQRTVLYLGKINDQQQGAWQKTLQVFDEDAQRYTTLSLFLEDREIPASVLDSMQVRLSGLELRRPRMFGNCWLGCELWHQLGLDEFWQQRLPQGREAVSWEKVLRVLVVNRLLKPGSEFHLHRQWFVDSAMDELLETDFVVADKDRLYRCLDRLGPPTGSVRNLEAEMGRPVPGGLRSAAVRSDQHLLRRGDGAEPQSPTRLQPGPKSRLSAVGDCSGGDAGRVSSGL